MRFIDFSKASKINESPRETLRRGSGISSRQPSAYC